MLQRLIDTIGSDWQFEQLTSNGVGHRIGDGSGRCVVGQLADGLGLIGPGAATVGCTGICATGCSATTGTVDSGTDPYVATSSSSMSSISSNVLLRR